MFLPYEALQSVNHYIKAALDTYNAEWAMNYHILYMFYRLTKHGL